MINQMRGLAKTFGLKLSTGKGQVLEQSVRRALPDDVVLRDLLESLLSVLSGLKDQRRAFARQLARFARENEACRLVSSAPGVGSLTEIAFGTAVDDPARFRSACGVGAYLGQMPKRYQLGEVDITGRISKAGDRLTRKLLFEAATVILYRASPSIALRNGIATECPIRKLGGMRCTGTQAGSYPSDDVKDQHDVREQELR
ncbi:transposase [Pseudogemmobacter sp. W21_MBD1_M6]|uniref:transposase n=1 Tax=Pseudogemmobacter sp. W21_MBD1_M6 TaxID=3240271 RepID=UPI003F9834C4